MHQRVGERAEAGAVERREEQNDPDGEEAVGTCTPRASCPTLGFIRGFEGRIIG
jgi:hypothetical protein